MVNEAVLAKHESSMALTVLSHALVASRALSLEIFSFAGDKKPVLERSIPGNSFQQVASFFHTLTRC
jgi:hypothetical protein